MGRARREQAAAALIRWHAEAAEQPLAHACAWALGPPRPGFSVPALRPSLETFRPPSPFLSTGLAFLSLSFLSFFLFFLSFSFFLSGFLFPCTIKSKALLPFELGGCE